MQETRSWIRRLFTHSVARTTRKMPQRMRIPLGRRRLGMRLAPAITLSPPSLPGDTLNVPYSKTITETGGIGTTT